MSTYAIAASQDMPPSALLAALNRAQERIHTLEQENNQLHKEIHWIDKLLAVPASIMSPSSLSERSKCSRSVVVYC